MTGSEALERIKTLSEARGMLNYHEIIEKFDIVETALKDYEKRLELAKEYSDVNNVAKRLTALEIIKKNKVCIVWLKNDLSSYNSTAALYNLPRLTQEEYDLLKEVLL